MQGKIVMGQGFAGIWIPLAALVLLLVVLSFAPCYNMVTPLLEVVDDA